MKIPKSQRRFESQHAANADAKGLRPDHPALFRRTTIFPTMVAEPDEAPRLLISGHNNRKIGKVVAKGRWRGMPIFVLSLKERATCPDTCHHWNDCMGNTMPFARRHRHGAYLEKRLYDELYELNERHRGGFVVRLHQLGDFVDIPYVFLWRRFLKMFPGLRIFGYTAHPHDSHIGAFIDTLNGDYGDRAYVRFSRRWPTDKVICAITVPDADFPTDSIICPAQTGRTDCCATCGLCWSTDRTIAFLQHGGFSAGRPKGMAA